DGDYVLGELAVEVRNGQAHIAGTDTIAGSTLVLADAVRNTIGWGVDWVDAVRAATLNPALYLGLPGVGELAPGSRADAVALASDWTVAAVLKDGVLLG
ncbi:amidohydrolase family protein, partial [Propioniciclava sp.]|uniref:amidohydrolase family protein n=1 Tax=Propioniciclava sp. TaxID=2038686 RepID=UPI002618656C